MNQTFPIWKTITIGGMNKEEYFSAFKKAHIEVGSYAKEAMSAAKKEKCKVCGKRHKTKKRAAECCKMKA